MEARLNPSLPPHFWELDPIKNFQPLCVDIMAQEPGIASADEYGKSGQSQLGIDILGKDSNGQVIVVGQCKCYKNYKATDVIKAGDDFYDHYQDWKDKGVTKFILFVACDLTDKKVQDEIQNQHTRFAKLGIHFEAWSGSILRNKLTPYPQIAQRHIHSQEVLRNICGPNIQGLVFTPNASIETTLQQLREAMREPDRYYGDIADLFDAETRKIISTVQNPPVPFARSSSELHSVAPKYLQPMIDVSERLVKMSATLIKFDRKREFTDVLIKAFKLLAQDPLKFENVNSISFTPGVPEIGLYPLALMIYSVYIVGIEYKTNQLLSYISKIRFRSQRDEFKDQNLPGVLWHMYYENITNQFFKSISPNTIYPIPESIKNILQDWLQEYLDFPQDAYYHGEFILSLNMLDSDPYFSQYLFYSRYLYMTEAKDILRNFITEKRLLQELFPDIDDRLNFFDKLSSDAARKFPYQRASAFYGNAFTTYNNS
jgi:hypothetical protein